MTSWGLTEKGNSWGNRAVGRTSLGWGRPGLGGPLCCVFLGGSGPRPHEVRHMVPPELPWGQRTEPSLPLSCSNSQGVIGSQCSQRKSDFWHSHFLGLFFLHLDALIICYEAEPSVSSLLRARGRGNHLKHLWKRAPKTINTYHMSNPFRTVIIEEFLIVVLWKGKFISLKNLFYYC